MRNKTNFIINFLLVIFSTFLFLFIIELSFRLTWSPDKNKSKTGFVIEDSELVWKLKPQTIEGIKTNEFGLRDFPYNENADVKILVLGDSITWGHGIDEPQFLYTSILETVLNEKYPNKTFEVINSGVPGYSTFQERIYLEKYGLGLNPDIIILQFCLNDIFEPYLTLASLGGDNQFLGIDTRKAADGIFGWFLQHSTAFEWAVKRVIQLYKKREEYSAKKLCQNNLSKELNEAWDKNLDQIRLIINLARQNNTPIIILIAPYKFQLVNPVETSQPQNILTDFSNIRGAIVIDLLPYFIDAKRIKDVPLFIDENHFSRLGHYITAKVIAKYFDEKLAENLTHNTHVSNRYDDPI